MKQSFQSLQARDLQNHGLFGPALQHQHMMMDDKWSPTDLCDELKLMNSFLAKNLKLKNIEAASKNRATIRKLQNLRKDCRAGRCLLDNVQTKDNRQFLRNFLWESKENRCLYQNMPVQKVLENVDHRTFGLRKEYDRLIHRKAKLEEELKERRLSLANLEDIDKFNIIRKEEFEGLADKIQRKLATCETRLKAIETINIVYMKIVQVLKHDEIFYDPILKSLRDDMNEQKTLIEYVLNLGKPALQQFHKLEETYKAYDETFLKEMDSILHSISDSKDFLVELSTHKMEKMPGNNNKRLSQARDHYMHTTRSMSELHNESKRLSDIIQHIKFVTVCSTAKEVYPRIKGQVDQNYKLKKEIICGSIRHATMETREKFSEVLDEVIKNNLSEAETDRENQIKELKELIALEDAREEEINKALRKSNNVLVIIRFFLWNVYDMLHHVYKNPRLPRISYPNSYLKLPLLRFEMMTMRAYPPEPLDIDFKQLLSIVTRKLSHLLVAYNKLSAAPANYRAPGKYKTMAYRDIYINEYIQRQREPERLSIYGATGSVIGYGSNYRHRTSRPKSRARAKAQSLRLLEERNKNTS